MRKIDLIERFIIINQREEYYKCHSYGSEPQGQVLTLSSACAPLSSLEISSPAEEGILREKICRWTFQMIDYFNLDREIVSVSLNYFDRYLNSTRDTKSITLQLVAMTSLFLAIKIYCSKSLRMSSLIELSQGHFDKDQIVSMENSILRVLLWRVHPPTAMSSVRNWMLLLKETDCSSEIVLQIEELVRLLTELSVYDYYFSTRKPSSTGFGAILLAFDCTDETSFPLQVRKSFLASALSISCMDSSSEEVQECKNRLFETYLLYDH